MQIFPTGCTHAKADACRAWLMLHSIREYCLLDSLMPCQMFASTGRSMHTRDDIS